jgi:hypothetical protein
MKITKAGMEIAFDLDCMTTKARGAMEDDLHTVLHKHGWTMWASGADCEVNGDDIRTRDIAYRHCKDMECEHWDGRSGCGAPKTRCVK